MQFKFFTTTAILEPGYLKLCIYCYRCYCSKCSLMAIGQGSLCFQEIMNRSFWHRFANQSWKLSRSEVMKRRKAEYFCKGDSPQIFDLQRLTFKRLSGVSEEMSTMHTCIWMDISLSSGRLWLLIL